MRARRESTKERGRKPVQRWDNREDSMEGTAFYLVLSGGEEMMQRDEGEGVHGRELGVKLLVGISGDG